MIWITAGCGCGLDVSATTRDIDGVITHNGKRDKKQYHFVFDIIFRTDVGV